MSNKYQHAIDVLQWELMGIGGQLFTKEFHYRALQEKAKQGDRFAMAQIPKLSPFDTLHRLMDLNQPQNENEKAFLAMAEAIELLGGGG